VIIRDYFQLESAFWSTVCPPQAGVGLQCRAPTGWSEMSVRLAAKPFTFRR
jgi:hypothetical protein